MSAVAIGVGVAGAAISAGVNAATASSGSKKAAKAQRDAIQKADAIQLEAAQKSYDERIKQVENANRIIGGAYGVARPELNQGYSKSDSILAQTYGQPAQAYIAESGTSPEQLNKWNVEKNNLLSQLQEIQRFDSEVVSLSNTIKGLKKKGSLQQKQAVETAQQHNDNLSKIAAIQAKLGDLDKSISTAQPYVQGQKGSTGFNDSYNYARGTDAGKRISTDEIKGWLAQNPGISDEEIMLAMQQHGISTTQLSEATGVSENDINSRIENVRQSNQGTAPSALIQGADKATDYLNAGYDAAGNIINAGYDTAGDYINQGYDEFGNLVTQGYDEAIGTQQPYYDTGTRALGSMEKMITNGNEYLPQDPGYQFRLDQGNKAINNSAASKGNLLSGATMKAIGTYSQGLASQEFQNAFSRWNELATKGQNAANTISGLQANRGQLLGTGEADRGTALASNSTQRAGILGNQATERGLNLASTSSNLGNNLANLYTRYGEQTSQNALDRGKTNADLTLKENQYYANNALGNADYYANTIGSAGKESANNTQQAGNTTAAGILGSTNAITQGVSGVTNALTQGLSLYGGGYQPNKYNDNGIITNNNTLTNSLQNLYRRS